MPLSNLITQKGMKGEHNFWSQKKLVSGLKTIFVYSLEKSLIWMQLGAFVQ